MQLVLEPLDGMTEADVIADVVDAAGTCRAHADILRGEIVGLDQRVDLTPPTTPPAES